MVRSAACGASRTMKAELAHTLKWIICDSRGYDVATTCKIIFKAMSGPQNPVRLVTERRY
jgi:hypothetical protein